jgi:hypothetical protein
LAEHSSGRTDSSTDRAFESCTVQRTLAHFAKLQSGRILLGPTSANDDRKRRQLAAAGRAFKKYFGGTSRARFYKRQLDPSGYVSSIFYLVERSD